MLTEPLLQQLKSLKLHGMAAGLEQQLAAPDTRRLGFEERFGLLLQHEAATRANARLTQRLRWAKLPQLASLEDLDTRTPRGLDTAALAQITDLSWIPQHLNVLITGPCGVGKSYLACALAHAACRADYSVRCFRLPRLIDELTRATALQKRSAFFRQLAKADLLVLDDFGLAPLSEQTRRDLLEIFDDRYDKKSSLITSQLPLDQWHGWLGEPTLADAILDRLVHNAYRFHLKGESMRKHKTTAPAKPGRSR
jgi:DNA replication protein DnaC